MPEVRVGISGWTYPPWRSRFYPKGLPNKRELEYASRRLNSIEINGTFYSMQKPSSFAAWFNQTPDDFVFAVKGSRFITHMKKLRDVKPALANFFASGLLRLQHKLGPILWQFPQQMPCDISRFQAFLEILPRDFKAAAELGKKHDNRIKSRAYLKVDENRQIRHAFEVRNPQFMCSQFAELLHQHKAALVFADSAGIWPYAETVTADFIYIRLHGATELYASGYNDDELEWWAKRIRTWASGRQPADARLNAFESWMPSSRARKSRRDVYVYFDNDAKVRAPGDAMRLAAMLSQQGNRAESRKRARQRL